MLLVERRALALPSSEIAAACPQPINAPYVQKQVDSNGTRRRTQQLIVVYGKRQATDVSLAQKSVEASEIRLNAFG
jgi:hypothetical protein